MNITSIASISTLGIVLAGVGFGPALNDVLVPPLAGEHRASAVEALTTPDRVTDVDPLPAMIHDVENNSFIVYPSVLPPCDDEDGTSLSNGVPVAACKWDDGTGTPFIVLSP